MRHTIDDLADLRTIELGVMAVDRHPTDLQVLLEHAVRCLDLASQHRVFLVCPAPVRALADAARLVRVITRLLQIALSTSLPGDYLKLALERRDDHVVVSISVAGTLAAATLRRVLESPEVSSRPRGERLGMVVARHAIEAHGGTLKVFDALGATQIELTLPLQPSEVRRPHLTPQTAVLIVDDNVEQGTALVAIMRSDGFDAELASTGTAALQRIVARAFDVIVVDFQLTDMTSLEVIERARQHQRNLPAVLLSGFPRSHPALTDVLAATNGAHVDKPFELATFYAALATAVERRHENFPRLPQSR